MAEAARDLEIPYTTYVGYEKGDREPNSEMLIKISNYYGVSVDYLICRSNDRVDERVLDIVNEIDDDILQETGGNLLLAINMQKERNRRSEKTDVFSIPGILPLPRLIPKPRLGTIACGTPIMSEENFDGFDLTPDTIDCDFTLIAQGDSMIGARIHDGDIVYVKHQEVVDNGQIAVVMIDDEKTLKRFYKNGDKVTLLPENPAYEPMVYVGQELENIRILGRAVAFSSYIR